MQAAGSEREPFVLAAGRVWDEGKNLELLAGLALELDQRLRIAGALGAGHEPDGSCLLGPITAGALAQLRRRAAVFAAPARYEPFGLSILEAATDGCALVLGDIPSLRELWEGAAEFVAPDDRRAWATTLQGLLERPRVAAELGARARVRGARYTADAMATRYLGLYRAVAAAAPRPGSSGPRPGATVSAAR
jgi:glycosyltransferase involved in cell wall biosynthesis